MRTQTGHDWAAAMRVHDLERAWRIADGNMLRRGAAPKHDSVSYAPGPYDAARNVDALVVVTEWNEFRQIDLGRLRDLMAEPVILDMRNIFRIDDMEEKGFRYFRIGSPTTPATFETTYATRWSGQHQSMRPDYGLAPAHEDAFEPAASP